MDNYELPPSLKARDPMARGKRLAERMARLLENQDAADVTLALALLTSGVVDHYAEDLIKAQTLLNGMRTLEDAIVLRTFGSSGADLH